MKNRIIIRLAAVVAALFTFCFLTSCQSKEERVISQLESLCKTYTKDLILSEASAEKLGKEDSKLSFVAEAEIRGKSQPMKLYTLEK